MIAVTVQPGDVLLTRSPGIWTRLIRLGAALRDEPNLDSHVAIAHHVDASGTLWCLEGRPGGAGWRDASAYLASPWTVTNSAQAKSTQQRDAVCKTAEAMTGTQYAWSAIIEDAGLAFGLKDIWAKKADGQVPGHIVCSSLAAYAYDRAGLAAPEPSDFRHVTPGDWLSFVITHHYQGAT